MPLCAQFVLQVGSLGIVSLSGHSILPERLGHRKGQPFLGLPQNRELLVVPFLFGRETLKLVTPDVCELLHVGQHLNVPVSRVIETGRFAGTGCHHPVSFHMAY